MSQVRLFIGHDPSDDGLLQELVHHLGPLERAGQLEIWSRLKICVGEPAHHQCARELEAAEIIVALATTRYFSSYESELIRAVKRQQDDGVCLIPIRLRDSNWEATPLEGMQPLPQKGRPIAELQSRDKAWAEISREIKKSAEEFRRKRHKAAEDKQEIARLNTQIENLKAQIQEHLEVFEELKNKHKEQEKTEATLSEKLSRAQEQIEDTAKKFVLAENVRVRLAEDYENINGQLKTERDRKTKLQEELAAERRAKVELQEKLNKIQEERNRTWKAQVAEEQEYQFTRFRDEMIDDLLNGEIAELLDLSENTVRNYRSQPDKCQDLIYRIRSDETIRTKALRIISRRRRQTAS